MTVIRETRDVTVRDIRIRAVEAGRGKGPPLLLIHGFIVTHAEWDDVLDELAQKFHVIAPDLPGFGDSAKPSPSRFAYGIEAFSESMADLVSAFGVGRVNVIGHSMGGAVALTLAAQHPELVNRLVVVDPLTYPFPRNFKAKLPLYPVVGPFIFKQLYGRAMFRAYFRDEVFSRGVPLNLPRIDTFYDKFNSPAARESAYATMRAMLDTRTVVARLGRVRAPTLVVWGRDDKLFPSSHAPRLAKELAHARLEIMDCGHSPAEEKPEQFLAVVNEFLEGRR
ncbi:MAG: alpha/beta hydrolase [Polyangiaceae bacterium]|nr:alpha/beta hydrolase [Polyangiaceae bacterium]